MAYCVMKVVLHGTMYTTTARFLMDRTWVQQLEGRGWFKTVPTLWLAEGLLMYLEQSASEQLLADMAGMLPLHSVHLASQLVVQSTAATT